MQCPNLLPADDAGCGWFHTSAPRKVKAAAPDGTKTVRWAIVGAGYTGLAAARQLARHFPDDEIVLIEAQQVGLGTAGRNAGFAIDLPHDIGAADYIGDIGNAKNVLHLNRLGQTLLKNRVAEDKIDCQLCASGKYQAAVEERGIAVLHAYQKGLEKLGESSTLIDGKDLPQHIGTSFYRKALFTPGSMLMQPAALVQGLAESLPGNVTLYEHTPITQLECGDKINLQHATGCIVADKVLLANNGFAAQFGFLRHTMLPIFLHASLTRPLTADEQKRLGGKDFWGVIPADPAGSTVRRTHDQRILMRNSMSFHPDMRPDSAVLQRFVARHRRSFVRRFPMLDQVPFEFSWSGCLAMSQNHEGYFGELAPNVYASLCCNGLGVTRGTAAGTLLADLVAGKTQEHQELIDFLRASPGPNKLPPQPFLSWGVRATLCWKQYRAGLEC